MSDFEILSLVLMILGIIIPIIIKYIDKKKQPPLPRIAVIS